MALLAPPMVALRRGSVYEGKPAAWNALRHGFDAPVPRVETCDCPPAASP